MVKSFIKYVVFLVVFQAISQNEILHFSTHNGLPHDLTYGLFQDSHGFVWIGTDNGVVKYDGKEFQLFNTSDGLSSNYVIAIRELNNQTMVLGTWGGGLQFIKNDRVQHWETTLESPLKLNSLCVLGDTIFSYYGHRNLLFSLDTAKQHYQYRYRVFKKDQWAPYSDSLNSNLPLIAFTKVGDRVFGHYKEFGRSEMEDSSLGLKGIYEQQSEGFLKVFPSLGNKKITALTKEAASQQPPVRESLSTNVVPQKLL